MAKDPGICAHLPLPPGAELLGPGACSPAAIETTVNLSFRYFGNRLRSARFRAHYGHACVCARYWYGRCACGIGATVACRPTSVGFMVRVRGGRPPYVRAYAPGCFHIHSSLRLPSRAKIPRRLLSLTTFSADAIHFRTAQMILIFNGVCILGLGRCPFLHALLRHPPVHGNSRSGSSRVRSSSRHFEQLLIQHISEIVRARHNEVAEHSGCMDGGSPLARTQ